MGITTKLLKRGARSVIPWPRLWDGTVLLLWPYFYDASCFNSNLLLHFHQETHFLWNLSCIRNTFKFFPQRGAFMFPQITSFTWWFFNMLLAVNAKGTEIFEFLVTFWTTEWFFGVDSFMLLQGIEVCKVFITNDISQFRFFPQIYIQRFSCCIIVLEMVSFFMLIQISISRALRAEIDGL